MLRLLSISLLALAILLPCACSDKKPSTTASSKTGGRKTMSRDAFESAVKGKTSKEVIAAIGEPDQKGQQDKSEQWIYASLTTDSSGQTDNASKIYFENGRATKFEYVGK
jgi:hypothetical protein